MGKVIKLRCGLPPAPPPDPKLAHFLKEAELVELLLIIVLAKDCGQDAVQRVQAGQDYEQARVRRIVADCRKHPNDPPAAYVVQIFGEWAEGEVTK